MQLLVPFKRYLRKQRADCRVPPVEKELIPDRMILLGYQKFAQNLSEEEIENLCSQYDTHDRLDKERSIQKTKELKSKEHQDDLEVSVDFTGLGQNF